MPRRRRPAPRRQTAVPGFSGLLNAGTITLSLQGGDTLTGTVGAKKLKLQGTIITGSGTASFSSASTTLPASQRKIVADQVDAKREAAKDARVGDPDRLS